MFWCIFFQIRYANESKILNFNTGFLKGFALCTLRKGFHVFQVASRTRIYSGSVLAESLTKKNLAVLKDKHTYTNLRTMLIHDYFFAAL